MAGSPFGAESESQTARGLPVGCMTPARACTRLVRSDRDSAIDPLVPIDDPLAMLTTSAIAAWAGIALVALARRLQIPAIGLLLIGGVLLGPTVAGLVRPDSLGGGLRVLVALAIGLVLFEGGLTLDLSGYRQAPRMIPRLLTVGLLVTLLGGTAAIHWLARLPLAQSFIAASLTTVTGPTVIGPLLKRLRLRKKLHAVLHWEGVLIDPIGVFIALLCFEWLGESHGAAAFVSLGLRLLAGLGLGIPGGLVLGWLLRRRVIPEEVQNVFILASALLFYGAAETVRSEAGLLTVTSAGFVLGLQGHSRTKALREFKAEIADLLIGALFILLAARLELAQFARFGVGGVLAVVAMMILVRPLSVAVCSIGLDFDWRERAFLSWVAPRGIVAASMASLIALRMEEIGTAARPRFAESFTYSVIIATVILQGFSAGWLARRLGLVQPDARGWILVGTHGLARRLAALIGARHACPVLLIDTNAPAVLNARREGFDAIVHDARNTSLLERHAGFGNLLALTTNDDLNARICFRWAALLGKDRVFRVELEKAPGEEESSNVIWTGLPGPTALSSELDRGNATLTLVEGDPDPAARVLGWWRGDSLVLGTPPRREDRREPLTLLELKLRAEHLRSALHLQLVQRYDGRDPEALYSELMARLRHLEPCLDRQQVLEMLLQREREAPSVLGGGVAVPHVYCQHLAKRLCAVAQIPAGLELATPDDEPVRLLFLLVSPEGDAEGHLATLAEIARVVTPPELRRQLIAAESPVGLIELIRKGLSG